MDQMNFILVVVLAASAFWIGFAAWRGLLSLRKMHAMVLVAFLALSGVVAVIGDKTNGLMRVIGPLWSPPPAIITVTETDIARGWRVESITANETYSYEMPTNAVYVGNWHIHGARSSLGNHKVDLGAMGSSFPAEWSFPLGTNSDSFTSFWYFVDGRIRPTPRDAAREIRAAGGPMFAMPGASRLWAVEDSDGSRVLTWENFFVGDDTNTPVNAQIRLYSNGDFTTSSNGVITTCRRMHPSDWDGDGIHNERDVNPTTYDGYFFGVANALPSNANPAAYYWLDLSVTGLLGVAAIRVTCDGPSELGDHLIMARTNEVCHVPLLIGASYTVESDLPYGSVAASDSRVEVQSLDQPGKYGLRVAFPLAFGFSAQWGSGFHCMSTTPVDVGAALASVTGGCCNCSVETNGFSWACGGGCSCGGGWHSLWVTAAWEGYSRSFMWPASCPCQHAHGANGPISISIPDTLFPNDDVDTYESPGSLDVDCGTQKLADDDLARCSVTLEGEGPMTGTIRLYRPSPAGAYAYCGEILGGFADAWYSESVAPSRDWEVDGQQRFTAPWAMEAGSTALTYNGMSVRADWIPAEGETVSLTSRFSIVRAVAEPICTATTNVVENGVARTLVLNPCGVGVGRDAYFSVEVNPAAYPDSKITWSQRADDAGHVDFTGPCGCTGRTVRVRGVTPGKVSLEVSVGGCPSDKPTFPLHVVTNRVRHISVWIAADDKGENLVRTEADVRAMLPTVNDVFAQIGMAFVIDSVNVLRDKKSSSIYYYEDSTNGVSVADREGWTFHELLGSVNGSDIKCIFVERFADSDDTFAATVRGGGIVMTSAANALTLAHELGHELGAHDIYRLKGGLDVIGELFCYNHAIDDWSNGCIMGGSGYYRRGITCDEIISRLLMFGHGSDSPSRGRDMTIGGVYGVYILQGEQCTKGNASVGFWTSTNGGQ